MFRSAGSSASLHDNKPPLLKPFVTSSSDNMIKSALIIIQLFFSNQEQKSASWKSIEESSLLETLICGSRLNVSR